MDIADFKAGTYRQQNQYKSFSPAMVNLNWTWAEQRIHTLLAEANLKLGELNAFSLYVPDVDVFISMHVLKEATTSSRIEGTKTNIEEALMEKKAIDPEKRDDWLEVQNYIRAMKHAIRRLNDIPLSTRLLKETHKILMTGVRGKTKMPGEYRKSQNWIEGATLKDAVFIPPHNNEVSDLMSDLEKFFHNDEIEIPELIRIAIAHYQFETIHPFLDGNGRLGRLMITLYLVSKGVLAKPTLYLSDYFEKHKNLYYDNLMAVRTSDNLSQWIKYFLVSVTETSKKGIVTFEKILQLKEDIERKQIVKLGRKLPIANEFLSVLFRKPIVMVADVADSLHVTPRTANFLVQDFVKLGILRQMAGGERNRSFAFSEYLTLFGN
ncbi:MAG: Fic family protein [Bacteroidota bacterium]